MNEFKIPPISTLAGSTLRNYFKVLWHGKIEAKYFLKIALTTLIVLISSPFHVWERIKFKRKLNNFQLKNPPLFILGHWRSGTTLLHNMLSKDPNAAYMTTYHSLFPNNLGSKWLFKTFMRINMPDKRPSDNVALNIDFPQEDEFAFSNSQPHAYYNFFYFPKNYLKFYERSVKHKNLSKKEIEKWYQRYDQMLKKAIVNTEGENLIIKNPVNTARIDKLLKLYPDAKFLYIYRNPITVYYSTKRFFQQLYPTLWLHEVNNEFIEQMILNVYELIMEDYLKLKHLIPVENLMEVRYESFEQEPIKEMEKIYSQLLKRDFSKVKTYFESYFNTQKRHKKNSYIVNANEIAMVQERWTKYINLYQYDVPRDITINQQ